MSPKLKNNWVLFLGLLFWVSCAGPPEVGITETTVYELPVPQVEYEYLLGPGDVIEIVYHYTPKPDRSEYYLAVGDVFKIEFAYHTEMNRHLTVRPDGNVSMPRIGDVPVIGLTPGQLKDKIIAQYSEDFKNPVVTVTMTQYNRAIDHLKKAITTAPRGQSKLTTVRPDGYITFPMLPYDIKASGRSVPQLKKVATVEYSKLIDNLTISLILKVMKANLVYVMGEVQNPNYYLMEGPTTVTQILARSGGVLNTAEKETVLIVTRDKKRRPVGKIVNLKEIIEKGNIGYDVLLNQYDVVYVPKTRIARADVFVDQYINQIVPKFFRAGIGVSYRLDDDD